MDRDRNFRGPRGPMDDFGPDPRDFGGPDPRDFGPDPRGRMRPDDFGRPPIDDFDGRGLPGDRGRGMPPPPRGHPDDFEREARFAEMRRDGFERGMSPEFMRMRDLPGDFDPRRPDFMMEQNFGPMMGPDGPRGGRGPRGISNFPEPFEGRGIDRGKSELIYFVEKTLQFKIFILKCVSTPTNFICFIFSTIFLQRLESKMMEQVLILINNLCKC